MKARITWIGIVVGLLGMSLLIHGVLLFAAISDPSFALEEDYEQKAASWDEHKRERQASAALGWDADLRARPARDPGRVDVELTLTDREGVAIEDAGVEIETFHNARASNIVRGALRHDADGRYIATLSMRRPGIWEFRIRATRGNATFVDTILKTVAAPARPGADAT